MINALLAFTETIISSLENILVTNTQKTESKTQLENTVEKAEQALEAFDKLGLEVRNSVRDKVEISNGKSRSSKEVRIKNLVANFEQIKVNLNKLPKNEQIDAKLTELLKELKTIFPEEIESEEKLMEDCKKLSMDLEKELNELLKEQSPRAIGAESLESPESLGELEVEYEELNFWIESGSLNLNSWQIELRLSALDRATKIDHDEFYFLEQARASDKRKLLFEKINLKIEQNTTELGLELKSLSNILSVSKYFPMALIDFKDQENKYSKTFSSEDFSIYKPILEGVGEKEYGDKFNLCFVGNDEKQKNLDVKTLIDNNLQKSLESAKISEKEASIAILISIKHGRFSNVPKNCKDKEAWLKPIKEDLRKALGVDEDENVDTIFKKMAVFSSKFGSSCKEDSLYTGNKNRVEHAISKNGNKENLTPLRLKRLPANFSRDLWKDDIEKWQEICDKIGLTPEKFAEKIKKPDEQVNSPQANRFIGDYPHVKQSGF